MGKLGIAVPEELQSPPTTKPARWRPFRFLLRWGWTCIIVQLIVPEMWHRWVSGPVWAAFSPIERRIFHRRVLRLELLLDQLGRSYTELLASSFDRPDSWSPDVLRQLSSQELTTLSIHAANIKAVADGLANGATPVGPSATLDPSNLVAAQVFVDGIKQKLGPLIGERRDALRNESQAVLGGAPAEPTQWHPALRDPQLALSNAAEESAFASTYTALVSAADGGSFADAVAAAQKAEQAWRQLQNGMRDRVARSAEAYAERYRRMFGVDLGYRIGSTIVDAIGRLEGGAQDVICSNVDTASHAYLDLVKLLGSSDPLSWSRAFERLQTLSTSVSAMEAVMPR